MKIFIIEDWDAASEEYEIIGARRARDADEAVARHITTLMLAGSTRWPIRPRAYEVIRA